jgi:uncharacterized membrane-anchored protein YhcB (DUF1043 family)
MSDLINKLNVLIRATVNNSLPGGAAGDSRERGTSPRSPEHLSDQAVDAQIRTLRQHIDTALDAEDGMRQKIEVGQTQADQLDQQVDAALLDGDESTARVLAQRLQQQRQRLNSQQADLEAHRRVTADLIEQVNQLEAQISGARASQSTDLAPEPDAAINRVEIPINTAPEPPSQNPAVPQTVRVPINIRPAARPSDSPVTSTVPAAPPAAPPAPRPVASNPPDADDDLARRRSRLSSPDQPDKR